MGPGVRIPSLRQRVYVGNAMPPRTFQSHSSVTAPPRPLMPDKIVFSAAKSHACTPLARLAVTTAGHRLMALLLIDAATAAIRAIEISPLDST